MSPFPQVCRVAPPRLSVHTEPIALMNNSMLLWAFKSLRPHGPHLTLLQLILHSSDGNESPLLEQREAWSAFLFHMHIPWMLPEMTNSRMWKKWKLELLLPMQFQIICYGRTEYLLRRHSHKIKLIWVPPTQLHRQNVEKSKNLFSPSHTTLHILLYFFLYIHNKAIRHCMHTWVHHTEICQGHL